MKENGFSKKVRLVHRAEFQRVRLEGRSAIGKYFRINVLQGNPEAHPRVGMITTRKFGNAVERNRFRRRFREIVRRDLRLMHPGVWLVGVARRDARDAHFSQLRDEWLRLAHKLSIFRNRS